MTSCASTWQPGGAPAAGSPARASRSPWSPAARIEAQHITSRICGICACAHSLTSIQAAEEALGVTPSKQTIVLRRLLLDLEFLDSHVLHIYLLALPDLVGAIEAPRGILFHRYAVDAAGTIRAADCVIPTNQNLASIERDMRAFVPAILHKSGAEITLALEMLVRSYDPCISCATHLVRI